MILLFFSPVGRAVLAVLKAKLEIAAKEFKRRKTAARQAYKLSVAGALNDQVTDIFK